MINLDPYIFFDGKAKEAMEFYKTVFGGEPTIQTYDQVPVEVPGGGDIKGKVMHAALESEDIKILASDSSQASPKTAKVELCLGGDDEPELQKIFEDLSEGGKVESPLKKEFWGDTFGKLTDKYGVDWMVNILGGENKK